MPLDLPAVHENLVVGETYLVPCVNGTPVIGEPHVDNDHFNHTENHYHCDSRFYDGEFGATSHGGPANCAVIPHPMPPTLEPRRCLRTTPSMFTHGVLSMTIMALYADYGFSKAKCGRCPHRGMPIINGVCSGHRLEWLPDGTIKYKPPYTVQIRGTNNRRVLYSQTDLDGMPIEIIEPLDGVVCLDMYDQDYRLIASKQFGHMRLSPGDQFHIRDSSGGYR